MKKPLLYAFTLTALGGCFYTETPYGRTTVLDLPVHSQTTINKTVTVNASSSPKKRHPTCVRTIGTGTARRLPACKSTIPKSTSANFCAKAIPSRKSWQNCRAWREPKAF